jgi:hypothetical protein
MGEGEGGIAASSEGSENNWRFTHEAHNVDFSPQEDRGGAAGEMGEAESGEEGGVKHSARIGPATSVAGFLLDEESLRAGSQMR